MSDERAGKQEGRGSRARGGEHIIPLFRDIAVQGNVGLASAHGEGRGQRGTRDEGRQRGLLSPSHERVLRGKARGRHGGEDRGTGLQSEERHSGHSRKHLR